MRRDWAAVDAVRGERVSRDTKKQGIFAVFGLKMHLETPNTVVTAVGYEDFAAKIIREFSTRYQGLASSEQGHVMR